MVQRNKNLAKLQAGYLFPEINRRKKALLERRPDARIISLGIGDTTEPLTPHIAEALFRAGQGLGTRQGYSGYGAEQGMAALRAAIADTLYRGAVQAEEVFVSDGAKCDVGRLQVLFGADSTVAVQDPSYPVYVDGSVILGQTGNYNPERGQFDNIAYMTCGPDNGFFPDLSQVPRADLIYFCSPNNPTGAAATREQLASLIDFARENRSIILYDAAYSAYIRDPTLPRSIFEIEGARETALEINSFSKSIGFTGVRLGWTVVPEELAFEDGTPVKRDWTRIVTTLFNGASNVVQAGGLAALNPEGLAETEGLVSFYLENARIIQEGLTSMGYTTYGGRNAPYIWTDFNGRDSWEVFTEILEKCQVVTTPGAGFGPGGQGFVRFSAFGKREDVEEAVSRLKSTLG